MIIVIFPVSVEGMKINVYNFCYLICVADVFESLARQSCLFSSQVSFISFSPFFFFLQFAFVMAFSLIHNFNVFTFLPGSISCTSMTVFLKRSHFILF